MGNVESSGDSDTQQGSDDINTSGDFEEFMDKEDLTSKILDKITTLKCLNTKFNRKRLVKKRTRNEVAYLHAGITHMIDIYQEFVDPGLPKKKKQDFDVGRLLLLQSEQSLDVGFTSVGLIDLPSQAQSPLL